MDPAQRSFDTLWKLMGVADQAVSGSATITREDWARLGGRPAPTRPPAPAQDDFERREELGRGAMGAVHVAVQRSLGREVAVKELLEGAGPDQEAALVREARTTGGLEHPGIPPVHALVWRDGRPAMVMKRIRGVRWRDLVGAEDHPAWAATAAAGLPAPWRHAVVALAVCDALAYAHAHGIVHRDVKPANVMIGAFGEVLLLDWGLAVPWEELAAEPAPRPVVGTPAYMAPEMVEGLADPRTDVYLLGAVLQHALTGTPKRAGANLYRVLSEIYAAKPFELPPELPRPLAEVVRRATEPDPAARFPDVVSLRAALREALNQRSALALAEEAARRVARAEEATGDERGRLLSEARFGYLQARQGTSDPAVERGLRACAASLVRHELAAGRVGSALSLLDELDPQDVPELRREIEEQRRLHERAKDLDPSVAAGSRVKYLTGLTGLMTGLGVVVSWSSSLPGAAGYNVAIWGSGNAALLTLAGMVIWRGRLFANAYNRTVMLIVAVASGGVFLNRTLDARLGTPVQHALVGDLVLLAALAAVVGVVAARFVLWIAALCVAAAVAATFRPDLIPSITAVTVVVGGLVAVLGLWTSRRT